MKYQGLDQTAVDRFKRFDRPPALESNHRLVFIEPHVAYANRLPGVALYTLGAVVLPFGLVSLAWELFFVPPFDGPTVAQKLARKVIGRGAGTRLSADRRAWERRDN